MNHVVIVQSEGDDFNQEHWYDCSCGWRSRKWANHNDYKWSNLQDEIDAHMYEVDARADALTEND
jgi:hypothetical protein